MTHAKRRAGISLLEVLISMFVLLIGLAGIASLLPAGRSEIMQGVKLDYAMMVGRNALRDLNARGYMKPAMTPSKVEPSWTPGTLCQNGWFEGGGPDPVWRPDTNAQRPFQHDGTARASVAVIIDPLAVYAGYNKEFPQTVASPAPSLRRVVPFGNPTAPNGKLLADAVFRCSEDLNLIPNAINRKDPPQQQILNDKRFSDGNYSWVATIVSPPATSATNSEVNVSVAVLYKRDLSSAGAGERPVPVTIPGGIWTAELTMRLPAGAKPMKAGQWFMLAGMLNGDIAANWYRVVGATEVIGNDQTLTVAGADWNTAATNTTAFVLDNVVAVYERTMPLEF